MKATRALLVALVIGITACSSGDDDATPGTSTSTTSAAADDAAVSIPDFTGDADSAFCRRLRDGEERPVADPFQSDIDADEVALRLRSLLVRFEELDEAAPPELRSDTALLVSGLRDLDAALDEHDHDLGAAAEAGVDVSFTDDPAFSAAAERIGAYEAQVCA